jgi:16S rRNA (guanine527-N7)-methyltransferase
VAPQAWFDLGSGGGSPAIPFKIAHPTARLTMVEATAKKAAFLREAVRVLELSDAVVLRERFENLGDQVNGLDLVTVRAVKTDPALFRKLHGVLAPAGRAFLFHSAHTEPKFPLDSFSTVEVTPLGTVSEARLTILRPVFHVEHHK